MMEDDITFEREISERLASTVWDRKIAGKIFVVRRRRRRNKVLLAAAGIIVFIGIAIFQFGTNEDVAVTIASSIGVNDASLPISEYFGLSSGLVSDDDINPDSIDTIMNE
jgi:hypothetical protein